MSTKKKKRGSRIAAMLIIVLLLAGAAAMMAWNMFAVTRYEGDETQWVYCRESMSADSLKRELTERLGHAGANAAMLLKWRDVTPAACRGAYRFEHGVTALDIYRRISAHQQTPVKLTFNNLRTLDMLAARVAAALDVDSAAFMHAADSILIAAGVSRPQMIGSFMPDSYEFYWTASPDQVVTRLYDHYRRFWTNERNVKAMNLGLTPEQVIIVASIAEEESNNAAERGVIGRLYINRLKKGMPLQADPTVKFAVGDFGLRRILNAHLAVESPYNTYRNFGLPPGPIRMPSGATIDAILNSAPNNYIYMCAREDFSGLHNFASDYATHLRNADHYRRALNKRNIK